MKNWKYWLVQILFAIGGVGWLVAAVKQLIKAESVSGVYITCAMTSFLLAGIFRARRKAQAASGPAKTQPIPPS